MRRRILASFCAVCAVSLTIGVSSMAAPQPKRAEIPYVAPAYTGPTHESLSTTLSRALAEKAATDWYLAAQENIWNAAIAENERKARAIRRTSAPTRSAAVYGNGACGGDLPPCSVMMCESGGDLTVYNHQGSGASGKWQITHETWGGYGGYENAADAPEEVQDARARQIYAGGRGRGAWSC